MQLRIGLLFLLLKTSYCFSDETSQFFELSVNSANIVVEEGTQCVISCTATSNRHTVVKWYKVLGDPVRNEDFNLKSSMLYNFMTVNATNAELRRDGKTRHISKITMPKIRNVDAGTYFCGAINFDGKFDFKFVEVKVLSKYEPTSFSLLLLIPVVIWLLIMSWLCYHCRSKKCQAKAPPDLHKQEPIHWTKLNSYQNICVV